MGVSISIRSALRPIYQAWKLASKYPLRQRFKISVDYLSLFRLKGITKEEYYDFGFDKQSKSFRDSFLGLHEQRFYLDYLNPIKYYSLARNKYLAHKVLGAAGIRQSELYCYYQPEAHYKNNAECASNLKDVIHILKSKRVDSCVIKTTESSHGDNVWVISKIEYKSGDLIMRRFDGEKVLLSSILKNEALIFESVVHQTSQFASFNESSVNTVRFMTTLWPDGSAKVFATFVKIGRCGKCVDNAGGGGNVDVCVDTDSGELKYAIQFDGLQRIREIECHPDNGCRLNGVVIENWQKTIEEVIQFQQAFPFCKAAGWDIAITDDGPVVIEVNDFWDRVGQCFIRHGWREEIRNCYMEWKRNGSEYGSGRYRNDLPMTRLINIMGRD